MCAVTDLLKRLAAAPGVYRGRGDGLESGPFVARIKVTSVVRGNAVTLDYEAVSDSKGLQHVEHTILTASEAGRLELHVTCLELPGVTRFVEDSPGVFNAYQGPMPAKIIMTMPARACSPTAGGGPATTPSRASSHAQRSAARADRLIRTDVNTTTRCRRECRARRRRPPRRRTAP